MKTVQHNLETIISQRLNLNTNQRILEKEFGIAMATVAKIKNPQFLNSFKTWDSQKKNRFIAVIGGRVNFNHTKQFIDNLIK